MIKKILLILMLLGPVVKQVAAQVGFKSPDGSIAVQVSSSKGKVFYQIFKDKKPVILPSLMGLSTSKGNFFENLKIVSHAEVKGERIQYALSSGKKSRISSIQNVGTIRLQNAQQLPLIITFRLSNDAVAFKYDLPGKETEMITIREEKTEYQLPANTLSWLQPMQEAKSGWEQSNPAYEEHYRQSVSIGQIPDSVKRGWVYPALLKTGSQWLAITEAGLDGTYCATRLLAHPQANKLSIGFPDPREIYTGRGYLPIGKMPFSSPWRVIALGSLKTVMESTAGTDFSPKSAITNTGFIKPGKASWSWIMSKDNFIVYEEQKKYIDYAAAMHWEYCMIDVNWDQKIGYEKIKELADYAKSKKVGLLLWYNSAGDWNTVKYTPKNLLLTQESRRKEFARIHEMGIKGVKIDFFGGDGQSVMQYYIDILKDAAKYELMVNFHGATLPRGWARTYPHLMTAEAVRGFENVSFQQKEADQEAEICATVPFARNLFDPMDYTPVNLYQVNDKIKRKTSSAFELALSVLFVSGIQHYAESPEGMAHVPGNVQQFLRDVPSKWDDLKFIDGYPGKYLVLARKAGNKWYIAGINSESKEKTVSFSTLPFGKEATLIANGDGQLNFRTEQRKTSGSERIVIPPQGGFVMVIDADAQALTNTGRDKTSAYLFTYFTGNKGGEAIRFALSNDGYHYRALNQNKPVLDAAKISATGGVRDPHILRGADGKTFYMVATDMNTEKYGWNTPDSGMVLLKSKDLVNWESHVVNVPALFKEFAKVNRVWAPQTIYDPQQKKYMIYWSMREGTAADKIYYAYANKDFTGLESTPKQLFFKADGGACIDGDIVYKNGKYHLFFKTEGSGAGIKIAVSDQLTKGYVLIDKYVQQTTSPVEGSGTFKLNNSEDYILMYDRYTEGKYQFTRSSDLVNFKAIDDEITMNFRPRHGTILPITTAEAQALSSRWMNADDMILAAESKEVKKINIAFDTAGKKAYLPVVPGTNLTAFNPGLTAFPGITINPAGAQDFSRGPLKYTVAINGKPENYEVIAEENHNPVIQGYYADPDILYAEKTGKFYIYPTSDGYNNWSGKYFKTFSSSDLVNWKDEGVILDLPKDVSWAKKNAWAPCIIEKKINGSYTYFYYFTAGQKIGVATSSDPAGPFTDSGKALVDQFPEGIKSGQQIDPDVFTDPKTGKSYLYWGNNYMAGAELNEDMISLKPGTTKILTPKDHYREGTYVVFRKGVYYFMWSENDTRNPNYTVHYGTSDSPLGEITVPKNNVVIAKNPKAGIYGPGHHAVIQLPGKDEWYIVYHRFNYPGGIAMGDAAGYNRELCIDKLEFNKDGSIREVIPTHKGIAPISAGAEPSQDTIRVKIDLKKKAQVIDNIGASGCWFSEGIGRYWPKEKKEKIAQLLFSKNVDAQGNPQGIGLSAWRFNIGAGTIEQGDSSGIKDFRKRSDSFLGKDGKYDWTKQAGYQFFLQKAHDYGVETLIAFSNSPPVQFTRNSLGYKTEKDFVSNLREDAYDAYAQFLATVLKHFDKRGLHFKYVSPVNEPQWDWSRAYMQADQEGSPWTNAEIYKITKALNTALTKEKSASKILITEAGHLDYLYRGSGKANRQIQSFFDKDSPLYAGGMSHVPKIIAGHSYFSESDDSTLVNTRKRLSDTLDRYDVNFWQSEYSMLGDGFKEGTTGDRSSMDCALFLSKIINTDLTVGNATAWQFWNAYEPGSASINTRYYLIALQPDADFKDGKFAVTKNLWALGHYSRFIRPGMTRVSAEIQAGQSAQHKDLLLSAYKDGNDQTVLVLTNYGKAAKQLRLDILNSKKKYRSMLSYLTTEAEDMDLKRQSEQRVSDIITLPEKSIMTIIIE